MSLQLTRPSNISKAYSKPAILILVYIKGTTVVTVYHMFCPLLSMGLDVSGTGQTERKKSSLVGPCYPHSGNMSRIEPIAVYGSGCPWGWLAVGLDVAGPSEPDDASLFEPCRSLSGM